VPGHLAGIVLRHAVDQREIDVLQPQLREILVDDRVDIGVRLDVRDDVDVVAFEAAGADRIADAALRVITGRGVEHAEAHLERVAHGVGGMEVELARPEPEQRHAIAGGHHVAGLGSKQRGLARAPFTLAQSLLDHGVHDFETTGARSSRP